MPRTARHFQQSSTLPTHILQEMFRRNHNYSKGIKMSRMQSSGFNKAGRPTTQCPTHEDFGGDEERS